MHSEPPNHLPDPRSFENDKGKSELAVSQDAVMRLRYCLLWHWETGNLSLIAIRTTRIMCLNSLNRVSLSEWIMMLPGARGY